VSETLVITAIGASAFLAAVMLLHASISGYTYFRRRFIEAARRRLDEAFVFIDPERVLRLAIVGVLVVPMVLWVATGGFVLPLAVGVASVVLPGLAFGLILRRRRFKTVLQLPDVLLMIASSLRAGTSLQIALDLAIRETPAPLCQELAVVMRETRVGLALEDALESMARRLKMEEIDLVVTSMTIARDVGGNLAETLDRLAGTLRSKSIMEGKIRSLTSQGKLQGLIVGLLPIFLLLVLSGMVPDAMRPLVDEWWGWLTLGVIAMLELIGFLMIRKIIRIDV
jgi:tight adherence protein B